MTQNGDHLVESTQKLRDDLEAVMERVVLCREMMLESPGIEHDETLSGVIGYLEACRDRMGDLIDAGAQGELPEDLFERCLTVNDAILRTLEAERTGTKIPVKDEGPEGAQKSPKPLIDMGPDNDEEEDGDRPVRKEGGVPVQTGSPNNKSFSKPKAAVEDSLLAPYVPPAGAPSTTTAGAGAAADPFANSGDPFADYSAPAVPPPVPAAPAPGPAPTAAAAVPNSASAVQPPAPPLPDSAVADLESLLGQTTVSPPPAVAASAGSSAGAQAADDFDAFLDSLNTK